MKNTFFGLFGTFPVHENERDELAAILREAAEALKEAEGVRAYIVYGPNDQPDRVGVFEVWDSPEAHKASLELPAVRRLIERARPLLAGPPETREISPLGGIGLP